MPPEPTEPSKPTTLTESTDLTRDQIDHFAEHGYVVAPGVVPDALVRTANQRIDEIAAADPPPADTRGHHFYFPAIADEPLLGAPLLESAAFGLAGALAGPGTLEPPWQVQIALNIPPNPLRPGRPHIDTGNSEPDGRPIRSTFTLLAGILMSDQTREDSGNLWIWPGTHLTHAAYFRERGPQAFCAYPDIGLPEPFQLTGRAGDLVLAHYLLGHNIGGNVSETARRALYFRISKRGHAAHRVEFLQDAWLDYDPLRSRPAAPPPAPAGR